MGASVYGLVRSDGAATTLVDINDSIRNYDASMEDATFELNVGVGTVTLDVTGLAAKTIEWTFVSTYTYAGA